jgi:hypothetical protein
MPIQSLVWTTCPAHPAACRHVSFYWTLYLPKSFLHQAHAKHLSREGVSTALRSGTEKVKMVGILLIVAGVAGLIYGGFSYTTRKKAIDMGPIEVDRTQHHSVPVPPILGLVAIAGGGALVYFGAKQGK